MGRESKSPSHTCTRPTPSLQVVSLLVTTIEMLAEKRVATESDTISGVVIFPDAVAGSLFYFIQRPEASDSTF